MGNHKVLKTAGINLRYSMYEFIDAVKQQNIIWDREHGNFHNRELRDQAWQQIGQQLCKNFEAASDAEKQEITKTLLKRWKNTRDSFLRVNRLRHSGEEIPRASYIYEKELSFLLDVKTEEEEEATLKEHPKAAAAEKRKQYRIRREPVKRRRESQDLDNLDRTVDNNTSAENGLNTFNYSTDTSTPAVSTIPIELNSASSSAAQPAAAVTLTMDLDPDQAFFDSIKPHLQRMSGDQKLDFQFKVLKILRNFKPN